MLIVQLLSGSTIFARFLQEAAADAPARPAQQSGMCRDANGNVQFCKAGHCCIPCPGKVGTRGKIHLCRRARSPLLYQYRAIEKAAESRASGQDLSDQMQVSPAELLQRAFVILVEK